MMRMRVGRPAFRALCLLSLLASLAGCSESSTVADAGPDAAIDANVLDASADATPDATDDAAEDAAPPDASIDATVDASEDATVDASTDSGTDPGPACEGDAAAALFADRVAADGSEHWLRQTATTTTYTIVPPGAPSRVALPVIWEVTRICGTQGILLATSDETDRARVDFHVGTGSVLHICVRTGFVNEAAALAAPAVDVAALDTTGCDGHPFTRLDAAN